MVRALPPQTLPLALERIRAWQAHPDEPVLCPVCGAPGLDIADRSARPYSEWYVLSCAACSLEHTLNIPLAPPASP